MITKDTKGDTQKKKYIYIYIYTKNFKINENIYQNNNV